MNGPPSGIQTLCQLRLQADAGRWPSAVIQGAVVPTIFLGIIGLQADHDALASVAVGLSVWAGMNLSISITAHNGIVDRMMGRDVLLRTAGVSRAMLQGVTLAAAVLMATISLVPLLLAVALGYVPAPATPFWGPVHLLGLTTFALTGAVIGAAVNEMPVANLLTNLVVFGLGVLCPVLYAADRAPALIRPVLVLLPPALEARALSAAWLGIGGLLAPTAMLFAWAIALTGVLTVLVNRSAAGR